MTKQRAGALILLPGTPFNPHITRLATLAVNAKLPMICWDRSWVAAGCFLSYGPDVAHKWRLAATYVDKVLKGAKPADLPVRQPTQIELAINLKTAKAIGVTIPAAVLARADHVIE